MVGPNISRLILIAAFSMVLAFGGISTIFAPTSDYSETEKRELAGFPKWSWTNFFQGGFTDSLDLYYADHFILRDQWVDWTAWIRSGFGWQPEVVVYRNPKPLFINQGDSVRRDTTATRKPELGQASMVPIDTASGAQGMSGSILVYNNAGFQLFGRGLDAEKRFAATVNRYKEILGENVRVFACIVPSALDFYLPDQFKSPANREKPSIEAIYSLLRSDVVSVDVYTRLSEQRQEFIYFKSDHHWTARGAYYGYRAFCDAAGLSGVPMELLRRQVRKPFYGSLYYLTRDPRLKQSLDSLEYFTLPIRTIGQRYPERSLRKVIQAELVSRALAKAGSYLAFIGGDYPLTRFISGVRNGKKILVIKDSYGNAFAPFLPLHFQEVWIVDYRSFDSNVLALVQKAGISDVMFLHSVAMANARYTSSRELELTKMPDLNPVILPDTIRWP